MPARRPRSVPRHVMRCWHALDECFARVEPTRWGAVITDARFPAVWDANYARVDEAAGLTLDEIEGALLPALRAAGSSVEHVVSFHPAATGDIVAELVARGHRLTWDLVMELADDPPRGADGAVPVEDVTDDPRLWDRVAASIALFGSEGDAVTGQLAEIERQVLAPAGKRWFGVRDERGEIVSLGAVTVLDDVAYIDNVATFEHARGRGYASGVTARITREARDRGVAHVCLLADPDDAAVVRMYEGLGFRAIGDLAATRGPVAI